MRDTVIDPNDIIKNYTVEELSQTAEDYFKSISNPTPQMAKPFDSLLDAPELLQNMGSLLSGLQLAKTMTVLEFAAGTCWFSRYLTQLQCKTISCDVSHTALEIGKRLFNEFPIVGNPISEPTFLHFDGHKIDLPDESVDRIVCNDGFHHVPNQEEVIAELARVLKNGGIAGFSEPGKFHSRSPQSQYEMRNYRVLENDILIDKIFTLAQKHGFTDISFKVLGNIGLSLSQFELLTNPLFLKLLRYFRPSLEALIVSKTIFFLHKGSHIPDSRSHIGLSCAISVDKDVFSVKAGESFNISVKVSNTGAAIWLKDNINDIGVVRIGTHLYDQANRLIDLDFSRTNIKASATPGTTFEQNIQIRIDQSGTYKLAIDLVSEQICWFEIVGAIPKVLTINVA